LLRCWGGSGGFRFVVSLCGCMEEWVEGQDVEVVMDLVGSTRKRST
jgi:hypothetical protein